MATSTPSTPSVLIDTNVERLGHTHTTQRKNLGIRTWGGETFEAFVMQRVPKSGSDWNELQMSFIPGIANLIKSCQIDAVTYWLLIAERSYNQKIRSRSFVDYHHFDGTRFREIDHPLFIHGVKLPRIGLNDGASMRRNMEHMVNLNREPRFLELMMAFGSHQKNSFDVHHLWFAERQGINYFLTADQKFLNKCEEIGRRKRNPVSFATVVLSPAEFGRRQGIKPTSLEDPYPGA